MMWQEAFTDEYGDPNLDTGVENVSTHYIVSAVIVGHDHVETLRSNLDEIRSKHFQTGPMKSSSIGDNDARRLRLLADLRATDLHGIALVIDKDRIHKDSGLRFQRPFRQFLNEKLYDELFRTFSTLHLTADRVGKSNFMANFKAHLEKSHHLNNLFNRSAMEWGTAREDVLLQAADIVCGSLGRCFDRKKMSPRADEIHRALIPWIQIRDWPWPQPPAVATADTAHDDAVRTAALQRAHSFIDSHGDSSDSDVRNQVACLKYLVFYAQHISPEEYVHAPEMIGSTQVPRVMTLRQFQTRIIAKLRDADVLIASDSRGYKLPSTMRDVLSYLRWTKVQVEPMVRRAKRMTEAIQLASNDGVRLLEEDEFKFLRVPS